MKKADPKASVCITNGYGKLGQCVIGAANGIGRNNGIPWSEMTFNGEPLTDVLKRENDALADVLRRYGTEVLVPETITPERIEEAYGPAGLKEGLNQLFPRDNVAIVANDLIEFVLNTPGRRTDILGLYGILREKYKDDAICWYSTPQCPLSGNPEGYPFFDARDLIQLDDRMVIGLHSDGVGTDNEGFRWMRNTFAFHDVRAVTLPEGAGFLGQALYVPRPGLVLVCREVVKELPSFMKDWDVIEVTREESDSLLTDILSLDERTVVIGYSDLSDPSRIVSELSARGIDVVALDFSAHIELGGSVGSSVLPLKRAVPQ